MRRLLAGFVLLAPLLAGQTGTISGKVTDDSGAAIAGAAVTANPRGPVQPGTSAANAPVAFSARPATVVSDAGGNFTIDRLAAGTYVLCANKAGSELLDPCIWSSQPVSVTAGASAATGVTAGANSARLVMPQGVTISVRVSDARGLLTANPASDDILIGAGNGSSPFIPAALRASDSGGRTMTLVVPRSKAVNVSVYSSAFQLGDANGKPLAASAATIAISASQTATSAAVQPGGVGATATIQIIGQAAKQ